MSTSTITVTGTLLSSTSLNTAGCTGAATSLGPIQVSSTAITATDCSIGFGSSNDTSRFRLFQADQSGTALTQFSSATTTLQGAPFYRGVAVASASEAWNVGYRTMPSDAVPISYTSDGGASWTSQSSCHATAGLYTAEHVAGGTVIAAGTSGVICRTTDSGATWTQVASPTSPTWLGTTSFGGSTAWISGSSGKVVRSTDAGASWSVLGGLPANYYVYSLDAVSATTIYGAAIDTALPRGVYGIVSTDGGDTWSTFTIGNTQTAGYALTVKALSPTTAVIGSTYGTYRTTDSGATWSQVDSTTLLCITAFDANNVVGYYSAQSSPRRSTNGGTTWANAAPASFSTGLIYGCETATATGAGFYGGQNDQRGFTVDAGATHTRAGTSFANQRGIAAWSADAFVSVGDAGTVRRSIDGITVTQPASGTTSTLNGVETFGDTGAVAVGSGGVALRSTDRGATWTSIPSGTASTLLSIDRAPDGWLYAVGVAGIVIRSSDDGLTWTTLPAPSGLQLNDVVAMGRDSAWIVGTSGVIYRTTNAGTTWTTQPSGVTLAMNSIDTLDGVNAIATTTYDGILESRILRTADGGATWTSTTTSAGAYTYDVRYLDAQTIVMGSNAAYRRSTDAGLTWISHAGPSDITDVTPLDANTFIFAAISDVIARVKPINSFPDFSIGVTDFAGTTGAFGACLHTAAGTATTSWPISGTGNCGAANLANWRAISNDSTQPAATIATTAASGSATLNLRFGAKPASTQKVGDYTAKLQLEVIAP